MQQAPSLRSNAAKPGICFRTQTMLCCACFPNPLPHKDYNQERPPQTAPVDPLQSVDVCGQQ
eukprot:279933-Chlamydomonas_euryale.AAC.1